MTIEDAVKILNERKHRGSGEWFLSDETREGFKPGVYCVIPYGVRRDEFEAVAIAEKYERDTPGLPGSSLIDSAASQASELMDVLQGKVKPTDASSPFAGFEDMINKMK